jgi:hypothetical protein
MLTQVHLLLTYACTFECDHCFIYCSPRAKGTYTLAQVREVLAQARRLGTVEWIYFEGGEPFLYYPVLLEGLRLARDQGFETGLVTNCYWATAREDAMLWLGPLAKTGIGDLSVSSDTLHHGDADPSPADIAAGAGTELGLPVEAICIEKPTVVPTQPTGKGDPVVGGGALFKGRAADKLAQGLPTRPACSFNACTHEELVAPRRVHVDAFGHVQVCQGVSIGNLWQTPLHEIISRYDVASHPICGPLHHGGPAELARVHGVALEGQFVDECHHCFTVRRALLDRFPEQLTPRQVYGLEQE